MSTTLATLPEGAEARIVAVEGTDGISMRLMEMGLIEGELIRALGRAPLGGPIEFEVRGYRLSLRGTEAARVAIERL